MQLAESPSFKTVVETLLVHGSSDSDAHWKLKLSANACLLMLLPSSEPAIMKRMTQHFFKLLYNQLPHLRNLATIYFQAIFENNLGLIQVRASLDC